MLSSHHRLLTRWDTLRNLILLVIVLSNVQVEAKDEQQTNYCDSNLFPYAEMTSHLQFKKEFVEKEYAISRTFKSLHCCAKGYRSIEW